ncbi:MAG: glutathione S-transferase family protein [Myxococcales bacterium]|nr:glutathione S-transferase family protein [Myxococcales bacterium]
MYKLYWAKSMGSMVAEVLFEEIGVEYEKVPIDVEKEENRSAEFLAINPLGQIPTLVLPDGTVMTESAAMVLQITDRHPEAKLAPPAGSPEGARFQRWLLFMATTIYPAEQRLFYADRITTDASAVAGIEACARTDMDSYFAILNDALDPGPYLLGESFSAVDVYLWMFVKWHPDTAKLFADNPRIARLVELVEARPSVAKVWAENRED